MALSSRGFVFLAIGALVSTTLVNAVGYLFNGSGNGLGSFFLVHYIPVNVQVVLVF
jgi:hypothetical protein